MLKFILSLAAAALMFLTISCGARYAFEKPVISNTVVYEGALSGDFKSSLKLMGWYRDVEACVGAQNTPPPAIKVMEGNRVLCPGDDAPRFGCHRSGVVIMPQSGLENVWKHEYVHYILWKTTGDADAGHTSASFRNCSGLVLLPAE